jgi:FxLD family lantipeptide
MTVRADTTTPDADFDLDVRLVEHADSGQLIYNTDDGCGSTCGACTTGAA